MVQDLDRGLGDVGPAHRIGPSAEVPRRNGQCLVLPDALDILQAELAALIQTYRFHQTALYRREKLAVAQDLNTFSERLVETLRRQAEANQATAADVVLAEVEHQATSTSWNPPGRITLRPWRTFGSRSAFRALRHRPSRGAVSACPKTESRQTARPSCAWPRRAGLKCKRPQRPRRTRGRPWRWPAAIGSPLFSIGPAYERNETGAVFYGVSLSSPVPLLNTGAPLVRQREAEYHRDCVAWEQARQLVATQVLAVMMKWNQAQELAVRTHARFEPTRLQTERMQRLYDAGQADLLKLLQVQRRYIDTRNVELDAIWDATQAYADLLAATGGTPLLGAPRRQGGSSKVRQYKTPRHRSFRNGPVLYRNAGNRLEIDQITGQHRHASGHRD